MLFNLGTRIGWVWEFWISGNSVMEEKSPKCNRKNQFGFGYCNLLKRPNYFKYILFYSDLGFIVSVILVNFMKIWLILLNFGSMSVKFGVLKCKWSNFSIRWRLRSTQTD